MIEKKVELCPCGLKERSRKILHVLKKSASKSESTVTTDRREKLSVIDSECLNDTDTHKDIHTYKPYLEKLLISPAKN